MTSVPKLSVTVLNYNYAHFLPECLDSIRAQTFSDYEVIIIDDCSTDDSINVVEPYLSDPRFRLIKHEVNQGYVNSLIEGTEVHSRGEYLTVVSADDLVGSADAFKLQVAALESRDDIVLCFSSFERFSTGETDAVQVVESFNSDTVLDSLQFFIEYFAGKRTVLLHSGTMFRKAAYLQAGGYRRDFKYAIDFALWPVLGLHGNVAYLSEPLYRYRDHGGQMSHSISGVRATVHESLSAIDSAFEIATRGGMPVASMRRGAVKRQLFSTAMNDVFEGRYRLTLIRCFAAISAAPGKALTARDLWVILARLLLGKRWFAAVTFARRTPSDTAGRKSGRLVDA